MKKADKKLILCWSEKDFGKWIDMRRVVEKEVSNSNPVICVCGRLATGMHEMRCKKFNDRVDLKTAKRLQEASDG